MPEPEPIDKSEQELAEALAELRLSPAGTSPRQIWYRAGLEAGRRQVRAWRGIAAALALGAGVALALEHRVTPAERIVYLRQEAVPSPSAVRTEVIADESNSTPVAGYLRLCDAVALRGLEGLPRESTAGGSGEPPRRERRFESPDDAVSPLHGYPLHERG